mgnify:FL=1
MKFAQTASAIIMGVDAHIIDVEAHLADGLVGTSITGLADTSVSEARDRVRAAVATTGYPWPQQRITVGLSPAWLPKRGSALDLAIALAVLAADGKVDSRRLHRTVVVGELGLDGTVRAVRGVLPTTMAAKRWGFLSVIVPISNAAEAALVPDIEVIAVGSLGHALRMLGVACANGVETAADHAFDEVHVARKDLADVRGQDAAKFALEVAAAGGHHLALLGPPGVGKTLLAERLPTILPPLEQDEALEVTAVQSIISDRPVTLQSAPPFAAPHHGSSPAALIGGGAVGSPRVGLITAAHRGVLFLDEAPEFAVNALEALRQPLESGSIAIARSGFAVVLPARFQLVIAANPCPCGLAFDARGRCTCTPSQRRGYLGRISGPLMDRIDVRTILEAPSAADVALGSTAEPESSADVAARVAHARDRQRRRLEGTPWRTNAEVPGPVLRKRWQLPNATRDRFNSAMRTYGGASVRGMDRTLRMAWTCADLAGHAAPTPDDLNVALQLRDAGGRWTA